MRRHVHVHVMCRVVPLALTPGNLDGPKTRTVCSHQLLAPLGVCPLRQPIEESPEHENFRSYWVVTACWFFKIPFKAGHDGDGDGDGDNFLPRC